jgi:hypothetical protein
MFLVRTLALVASAIVSMRFAFYLRAHFDFSDHASSPNSIRRRQQRTFAPRFLLPRAGSDTERHHAVAVRANIWSILVAMMKSFSCSPLIFLVCKETVALPQPKLIFG